MALFVKLGPPRQDGLPPDFLDQLRMLEVCTVFFATTYWVGRGLYRLLGREEDAAEVKWTADQHIPLLHLGGGVLMSGIHIAPVCQESERDTESNQGGSE